MARRGPARLEHRLQAAASIATSGRSFIGPDQFRFLCDILAQSNFPHDQEQRGLFDPDKLSVVPGSQRARRIAAEQQGGAAPSVVAKIEYANLARFAPMRPDGCG